jgi:hypothetical protein
MVGSQKVGTHTASFSLFAVASYTMRISSSPLRTAKYLMFDFTNESEGRRYLRLSTFEIFSLVGLHADRHVFDDRLLLPGGWSGAV